MLDAVIKPFIRKHQLPESYADVIETWFFSLAEVLISHQRGAKKPLVIGINGAQGSGKSTLADLLVVIFEQVYQLKAVGVSIDDFYLTRQQRNVLATEIHPLLQTRGVPGTHDVELAISVFNALLANEPVAIPRFNKAVDDRYPIDEWHYVEGEVDIIVIEGWCLGAEPQDHQQLISPVNDLEADEDPDLIWRHYINQQLLNQYLHIFNYVDQWVMLKAPSFDCVYQWRLEQENKLKTKHQLIQSAVMSECEVERFTKFFQRITEHVLTTLPMRANYTFYLDSQRQITSLENIDKLKEKSFLQQQLLIFTDMDGSLLNHENYDFAVAKPLLADLNKKLIPVIPCTSKTYSELIDLRIDLNSHAPFIVENGAAVFIPMGAFTEQPEGTKQRAHFWVKSFVEPRSHWLHLIDMVKHEFVDCFYQFSHMSIDDIMLETGLERPAASQAAKREYGEPVLWRADEASKQHFIERLQQLGASVLHGGRFIHVSGKVDKATAMNWLTRLYQNKNIGSRKVITLAIGDSQNDIAMLEVADFALMIRSPAHDLPQLSRLHRLYVSQDIAPLGWKQGVEIILNDLTSATKGNHG